MSETVFNFLEGLWKVVREAVKQYTADKTARLGAALAFYSVFSLAPVGAIIIGVVRVFYEAEAVEQALRPDLVQIFGTEATNTLFNVMTAISQPGGGTVVTSLVAVGALLFGATAFFSSLKGALDAIWRVEENIDGGLLQTLKTRGLALLFVVVLSLVVLLILVTDRVLDALLPYFNQLAPDVALFQPEQFVRDVISLVVIRFGLIVLVVAFTFKTLPDAHIRWRDLWVGSGITALLFLLGQAGISFYLGQTNVAQPYGAAGSLVLILVWIYYSSQVFLFGAQLTYVYAEQFGGGIQADGMSLDLIPNSDNQESA